MVRCRRIFPLPFSRSRGFHSRRKKATELSHVNSCCCASARSLTRSSIFEKPAGYDAHPPNIGVGMVSCRRAFLRPAARLRARSIHSCTLARSTSTMGICVDALPCLSVPPHHARSPFSLPDCWPCVLALSVCHHVASPDEQTPTVTSPGPSPRRRVFFEHLLHPSTGVTAPSTGSSVPCRRSRAPLLQSPQGGSRKPGALPQPVLEEERPAVGGGSRSTQRLSKKTRTLSFFRADCRAGRSPLPFCPLSLLAVSVPLFCRRRRRRLFHASFRRSSVTPPWSCTRDAVCSHPPSHYRSLATLFESSRSSPGAERFEPFATAIPRELELPAAQVCLSLFRSVLDIPGTASFEKVVGFYS